MMTWLTTNFRSRHSAAWILHCRHFDPQNPNTAFLKSPMDRIPPHLLVEILSRLNDSADLARCRLVSKTLASLSREVRSIHLRCSFDRYMWSRSSDLRSSVTPFKDIFRGLVSASSAVESVSIGVEKPFRDIFYDDLEDESDDLYLTDGNFVKEWLPRVCDRLKSLSISDFWVQSCWRRSSLLSLLSSFCHNLLALEVRNAWLSVEGLNPMPMLTSLTLEFIRLDDEDLDKVNESFPSLQVINLIGVGGLRDPKIHLLNLKTCYWTVSNAPSSLTLIAPKLTTLKLECVRPGALLIEAPLLSHFHLSLEMAGKFEVREFCNLKTFWLESSCLEELISTFTFGMKTKSLIVDSRKWACPVEKSKLALDDLLLAFPGMSSLTLRPLAWSDLEASNCSEGWDVGEVRKGLKVVSAYLLLFDPEMALSAVISVLQKCPNLTDMSLLIHRDVCSSVLRDFIAKCMAYCPRVRWRWGLWKEGTKDAWISDGI